MKIGCILLAAGSGKRFGGNKLLYAIDGVSLLERACMLHAGVSYAARILVARNSDPAVMDIAKRYGFAVALNDRAAQGIGTSAATGAAALLTMCGSVDGAIFAVCDQPYLTRATVLTMIDRFCSSPDAVVAPTCNGKRGNPVLFPSALLGEFASLDGDVGGSAIIGAHRDRLLTVPLDNPAELFDVDYQMDESRNP